MRSQEQRITGYLKRYRAETQKIPLYQLFGSYNEGITYYLRDSSDGNGVLIQRRQGDIYELSSSLDPLVDAAMGHGTMNNEIFVELNIFLTFEIDSIALFRRPF